MNTLRLAAAVVSAALISSALTFTAAHAAHQPTYDLAKAPGSAADAANVLA